MRNLMTRSNNNIPTFFNDIFDDEPFQAAFRPFFPEAKLTRVMKTDIKETEKEFVLDVEVPGFQKEDITLSLDNGYLTVSAKKSTVEDDSTKYLHRERSVCSQRSFYVGEVSEDDVKAKYENGVLTVSVPKETKKPEKKGIAID